MRTIDIYLNNLNLELTNTEMAMVSGAFRDASVFLSSAKAQLALCKSCSMDLTEVPAYIARVDQLAIKFASLQVIWNIQQVWNMLSFYSAAINNNHLGYALSAFSVAVKQIRTLEEFYFVAKLSGIENCEPYIQLPQQIFMMKQIFSTLVVAHNNQDLNFSPISTRLVKNFGNFSENQKELGIGLTASSLAQNSQAALQRYGQFSPVIEPPLQFSPVIEPPIKSEPALFERNYSLW